jgi:hypothetical protein
MKGILKLLPIKNELPLWLVLGMLRDLKKTAADQKNAAGRWNG